MRLAPSDTHKNGFVLPAYQADSLPSVSALPVWIKLISRRGDLTRLASGDVTLEFNLDPANGAANRVVFRPIDSTLSKCLDGYPRLRISASVSEDGTASYRVDTNAEHLVETLRDCPLTIIACQIAKDLRTTVTFDSSSGFSYISCIMEEDGDISSRELRYLFDIVEVIRDTHRYCVD